MKLKNTTGEGRKICDGDLCTIVENGEVFEVSDATGATLIAQGFTAIKPPTKSSTPSAAPDEDATPEDEPESKPHKRGKG
jgi:hypothetical protein